MALFTLEPEYDGSLSLRIGLNYAKGLRQSSAQALLAARNTEGAFASADDLALRVPSLNRKELVSLARIGALNSLGSVEHRRDALWQVEQAAVLFARCCAVHRRNPVNCLHQCRSGR
jgi:error-prone DNA polymerase